MFDFDYRIECYTPEAKRRYGYFTLPILVRGELVGRVDAKAHRDDGVFEGPRTCIWNRKSAEEMHRSPAISLALHHAALVGTPSVRVVRCQPAAFARPPRARLRARRQGRQ